MVEEEQVKTQTEEAVAVATTSKHARDEEEEEEEEEEPVVTLSEVLQQDALLSEAADAVLGDCSETHCSYPMGYIRQAVYACLTCTPDDASPRAGICLACSYNCHADHELIELYTKRNFRCDCGNDRFPKETPCKLMNDKDSLNTGNTYSQNYHGKYCTCHRPYPDPERTTPEVMVQCIICEDWLHQEHIFSEDSSGSAVPEDFDELICLACMEKHPFLLAYTMEEPEEEGEEEQGDNKAEEADKADGEINKDEDETATNTAAPAILTTKPPTCVLVEKQKLLNAAAPEQRHLQPTFWPREWREALCQCTSCVSLFDRHKIAFLLDPEDTLHAYEAKAREQTTSTEVRATQLFASKLSHEQQVEMAIGYNHMKNSLQQYLSTFAAGGKTVRAEDIQSFFAELKQNNKRRKIEP